MGCPQLHTRKMHYSTKGVQGLFVGFIKSDAKSYRYGFNGQEKDDEISGAGNSLDFGARIYDSRLGRWLSLDAYASHYPSISAYSFGLGNPIYFIDKGGNYIVDKDGKIIDFKVKKNGTVVFKTPVDAYTKKVVKAMASNKVARQVLLQVKDNKEIEVQYLQYPKVIHDEDLAKSKLDNIEGTTMSKAEYDARMNGETLKIPKIVSTEYKVINKTVKQIDEKNPELYNKQVVLIDDASVNEKATKENVDPYLEFILTATEESLHTQQKTIDNTPGQEYKEKEHEKEVQPVLEKVKEEKK
jgi:RHS repeat-associated protein